MKKVKFNVIAMVLLVSCRLFAGSVSGGGGGITYPNPKPVTVDEMIEFVKVSKIAVWDYFKESSSYRTPETEKLLRSGIDVFSVLDRANIVISKNGCTDFFGNFVDASINTTFRFGVCLDIISMQKKLFQQNYRSQLLALIIHEVSHHLGADEPTAEAIQKEALVLEFHAIDRMPYSVKHFADDFSRRQEYLIRDADNPLTTLIGLSTRLRSSSPPVGFYFFEFAGMSTGSSGTELEGGNLITEALRNKWNFSANWQVLSDVINYTRENDRSKYKSNIEAANAVDSVADDIQEYIRQIASFNAFFAVTER